MPTKQTCRYCRSSHPPRQCLAYKEMHRLQEDQPLKEGYVGAGEPRVMNEVEQETAQDSVKESSIDSVNINSIHLNKNNLVVTANLKTLAGKNSTTVPYKVDKGSDGNIAPLHIYNKLFPRITNEQLAATEIEKIQLKT